MRKLSNRLDINKDIKNITLRDWSIRVRDGMENRTPTLMGIDAQPFLGP